MRNIIREPVETMKEVIQKSSRLEAFLKEQIIGQEPIIESLSNCIKYGWCQLSTPGRPRGTLFLLGPTGVGKTESIRSAVQFMYGNSDSHLLRLDMSEFSRQAGEEALINLLGSPGGKSMGRLEQFLENTDEGIILYDEIEKAHSQLFTILLQQLDAARITLSNNRTYNLERFFLVATSNIGAQIFQTAKHLSERRLQQSLEMQLKQQFSPEFIARFGKFGHEILIFRPLKPEHLRMIARKFYAQLLPQYRISHRIDIRGFSADMVETTLRTIDNTRNGARELRSSIERTIRQLMFELLCNPNAARTGWIDIDSETRHPMILATPNSNKEFYQC